MSKSLKQMAYDTIEAHQETIADLRTQLAKANETISALSLETDNAITLQAERNQLKRDLAKANERVKELELTIVAITHADETGYVNDVGFVQGWSEVCDETKSLLNKFAIEKKLKVLDDLLEEIQCSAVVPKRYEQFQEPYLEGIKHCIQFIECQSKQLRKEQE